MRDQMVGIETVVNRHEKELYGDGANLGVSQKVAVLWRIHTWLLCTLSALAGSAATIAVQKIFLHP